MIIIDFVDFWEGFDKKNNYFVKILYEIYGKENIVIGEKPNYLFYSCFGNKNLKYNCIKIFYSGENIVPDFNLCDYAMGLNELDFGDRYQWFPLYLQNEYINAYQKAINREHGKIKRSEFCCYVISNALGNPTRKLLIDKLTDYKELASGGKYRNNVGGPVKDKIEFEKKYKFTLCMENSSAPGYVTEKLIEGFAGGGIPIYWGDPSINEKFNEKAFINCMRYESIEAIVNDVVELDRNDDLYNAMISEPIFTANSEGEKNQIEKEIRKFISNIFDQDIQSARRLNDIYIGHKYLQKMKRFEPAFQVYRFFERFVGFLENYIKKNK